MRVLLLIFFLIHGLFYLSAQDSSFNIRAIKITGNKRTKSTVFLREIGKNVGDTVTNPKLAETVWQKRISGLGLFNLVRVSLKNDSLLIYVKERIYTWGMPRLEWADRNFNVWYQTKDPARLIYGGTLFLNNLWGLNHNISLTIISGYNHIYDFTYNRPFNFYSRGWGFSFRAGFWTNHELWYKTENDKLQFLRIENKKIQENDYVSTTQKKRFSYYTRLEITEGWNRTKIDSAAVTANPKYLLKGNLQNEYYLNLEYISDHRDQRDYPSSGYLFRAGLKNSFLKSKDSTLFIPAFQVRVTAFKPIRKKMVLVGAFSSRYVPHTLPYNLGRQLGYQNDYVRGYEPYVSDGSGFVLGKLALRKALLYNKVISLGNKKPLKNYRKVPLSLWFNIFADAGHVLMPVKKPENVLPTQWQTGAGVGLDIVAWYSALIRLEYSLNALGGAYFNLAFKNAF